MMELLEEKWDAIRAQLKSVWHDLTDSDLEKVQGNLKDTVSFLKEKYGLAETEVVQKLQEISDDLEDDHKK